MGTRSDRRCKLRPSQRAIVALVYLRKHRRHGVNFQVITGPRGKIAWVSRALPGRTHDLTAARDHRVVKTCATLRIPAPADLAHTGAGGPFAVPIRRKPGKELTPEQRSLNRAHARFRHPVERGAATLKHWRIFRHARCSPNRLTSAAKAVLTLELQR
ncbi:transposase family protein [Kitasatospora sp. NPDC101235]|uniref:transposase family protein n=1 Tax=Kitasatospora sp. NPDC101235 TaxID=3364101 RepID=UPI00380169B2